MNHDGSQLIMLLIDDSSASPTLHFSRLLLPLKDVTSPTEVVHCWHTRSCTRIIGGKLVARTLKINRDRFGHVIGSFYFLCDRFVTGSLNG